MIRQLGNGMLVSIDGKDLIGTENFHSTFQEVFGFPDFYGRNMNAWNDCMSSLDEASDGLTTLHVAQGQFVTLYITNVNVLRQLGRSEYEALIECAAFVNYRRVEIGLLPIIALSFYA